MRASDWVALCDGLISDVRFLAELAPLLEDHAHRSNGMRFPVSGAGPIGSQSGHSDPVLGTVTQLVDEKDYRGGPREEEGDRAVLARVRELAESLSLAINRDLAGRIQASATAVREGRPATSGRDQVEEEVERHGRAIFPSDLCLVCSVVGPTELGMCKVKHYMAWYRSVDRAQGVDRGAWVARERHRWLVDELVSRGVYGEDVVNLGIRELEEVLSGRRKMRRHRGQCEWDQAVHSSTGPADGEDRRGPDYGGDLR